MNRDHRTAPNEVLGADVPITRRDFLNGVPIAVGSTIAGGLLPELIATASAAGLAPQDTPGYYPPTLTGLRGNHAGSFEAAHGLRDAGWSKAAKAIPTNEAYDLVVVGGGISGLAAAHFYRATHEAARILILDNHDDFGGHAKRNEFQLGDRLALVNGGTADIDSPKPYSDVADGLLKTLGINPVALTKRCTHDDFYPSLGLGRGLFFDKETFGADKLLVAVGRFSWMQLLAESPLSPAVQSDIARIEEAKIDYLPGLSSSEKKARLSKMSYRDYLLNFVKADPGVIPFYQAKTHEEWGVGIDAISALDVWGYGEFPGFQGLHLEPGSAPHMGYAAAGYADAESYTFHFPDGNASIARLLVRNLIPESVPGNNAEDVVTARVDYSRLDRLESPVRIRLSSTVVRARNIGDPSSAREVEIAYQRGGELNLVRARSCVLACYNMMIPYLCPELPETQKEALKYPVKAPLIYASVALRNWTSFKTLGISEVYSPGSFYSSLGLNPVIDIGEYRSPRSPDEPVLIQMVRVPAQPGLSERDQHRAGQLDILNTSFETFEHKIREQLGRILGPGGFDPARDITAITVNRWPHGYAYEYNPLFDPDWPKGQEPHVIGRAPFGRIAIANSDAGAASFTDSAIDQAYRAVQELLYAERQSR